MKTLDELLDELPPERRQRIAEKFEALREAILRQYIQDEIEDRR